MTKAWYHADASRRKWAWVLKVFEERKKQRNEAVLKEDYSSESIIQEDIEEMSDEMLDFTLASFVAEVRKEDGQECNVCISVSRFDNNVGLGLGSKREPPF